ncbi:porin [Aquabacterium sp. OR-4]|uniref:porin n=1 Tax=Aquabacterium sp. OR-4 TaxID=2978127 RepID=UPI0021B2A894|nr:porin [Aquabacterium sp. OR-4]MDT7834825.1 porin [Aquabacterium sp. OR-4]
MQPFALRPLMAALALAAVAGGAAAQSSVTIFGLVDLSAGRTQAPGGAAVKGVESGKMTTSYWGLRGQEDLGGGLFGVFSLESFMRSDTGAPGRFDGDGFWARNSFVGLRNELGTLTLGRNTTSLFVQTLQFNALGDSFGYSPSIRHYFTSGTTTGDTGWSDSVKYVSPKLGGFTATAMGALGEGNGGRNMSLAGHYGAGDLALGATWQKVDKGASVADTTTWQLAGSYAFGPVRLFGQYGEVDNRSTRVDYTIAGLGAAWAVTGQGSLLLQVGRVKPATGAKRGTVSGGYDYYLSKRTDLYAVVMSDRLSGAKNGTSYSVGGRHRF